MLSKHVLSKAFNMVHLITSLFGRFVRASYRLGFNPCKSDRVAWKQINSNPLWANLFQQKRDKPSLLNLERVTGLL